jgi:hypothetical protein
MAFAGVGVLLAVCALLRFLFAIFRLVSAD